MKQCMQWAPLNGITVSMGVSICLGMVKNDISTNLNNFYAIKSRFVSIFIFVSIETLDLDISKTDISTVEKISPLQKR
jgi:hypothetical protein